MTTIIILVARLLASLYGCAKGPHYANDSGLGTVIFRATQSNAPFTLTGVLEVFHGTANISTYFGNYANDALNAIKPQIIITAKLANGSNKSYISNLTNALLAGNIQTINFVINPIVACPCTLSEFSMSKWTETSQNIEFNTL